VYGETKYEGEQAVLEAMAGPEGSKAVVGMVLRVPLLYGHCEADDPSKSAVHPLVDAVWQAQSVKEGEPKIKSDNYGLRYPTATEDVGRVCVDIAKLYYQQAEGDFEAHAKRNNLPRVLHFSSEDKYTKYEICKLFAEEILGLPINGLEPWDPTKADEASQSATVRPYNTHLDTSALKDLGIDVSTLNFVAWW
jgi:dTDP-4-dehydrorhamnose reductase